MHSYELMFLIDGVVTDERQDELLDHFDEITVSIDPYQRCTVTGQFEGESAVLAARQAIDTLHSFGFKVSRMTEDYVDRTEIAARLGVTRQAVGNWIKRQTSIEFPGPAHRTPGEIWLWHDVVEWLGATGRDYDSLGTSWPTQICHDVINGELARLHRADEFNVEKVIDRGNVRTISFEEVEQVDTVFSPGPLVRRHRTVFNMTYTNAAARGLVVAG